MSNIYTAPTLSGYNDNAPPDDGSNTSANEITWASIKTKIGDPLKAQQDAMNSNITTACGRIPFNTVEAESANYSVVTGDRGKLISFTNTVTATLLAAGSAGAGFCLFITNDGSGLVTISPNGGETVVGSATQTLSPGNMLVIVSDGSNWVGSLLSGSTGAAASGYTRISPNLCRINIDVSFVSMTTIQSGAGTDTTHSISAPSSSATALIVKAYFLVMASASTSNHDVLFYAYSDSGRTTLVKEVGISMQETAAMGYSSGNTMQGNYKEFVVPLSAKGGTAYLKGVVTGNGSLYYKVVGYIEN